MMSYSPLESINKVNEILSLVSKRQQAISSNLTNIHTPGYLRQDINFAQHLGSKVSPIETELSKKLGPAPLIETTGEKVSPQEEFLIMQKNLIFYTLAARRASTVIQEIKSVAMLGR